MNATKKRTITLSIIALIVFFCIIKLLLNNLLLAENGDTYDFFKVAYQLKHFNIDYQSKRNPLLPLLLAPFPDNYFVYAGRFFVNLFYLFSVVVFYKIVSFYNNKEKANRILPLCASLVFATNIIVFENSFYIMADSIFLFWNLLFIFIFQKYTLSKPNLLALITALAFYTRPEGSVLTIAIVIYTLTHLNNMHLLIDIKHLYCNKNLRNIYEMNKATILNTIYYILYTGLFLIPHFIRNYYLFNNLFYSGYLKDEAGFLFDIKSLALRLSNYAFGLGGIWFIPFITTMGLIIKDKIQIRLNIATIIFIMYSLILIAWGPYIRLYSVPIAILIMFVFFIIDKSKILPKKVITKNTLILFLTSVVFSITFYYIATQPLGNTDLGYRKIGKAMSIILSIPAIIILYLYLKQKINYLLFLYVVTFLICILNITIFIEKFSVTRYKYYTLKQACELYLNKYSSSGNLGYNSGSGLESWYLKDFKHQYDFLPNEKGNLFDFAKSNQIKYIVVTRELGFRDKFSDYGKLSDTNSKLIKSYKSPFFSGETALVELIY